MTDRRCPVPCCTEAVPKDGVFCVEHYFQLPAKLTSMIFRVKFEAARATDPTDKAHLESQLAGYIRLAISKLPAGEGGSDAA